MKRLALPFIAAVALLVSAAVSFAGTSPPVDPEATGMSLVAVGGYLTWALIALAVMVIVPRRAAVITACSLVAVLVGVTIAGAQTTTVPAAYSPIEAYRPLIQDIATLAITALSGLIARVLYVKWGIDVTAERRASFQVASTNAAGLLASTGDMPRAVEYLKDAAPDAIKHFQIPDDKLPEKIEAKIGILEAGSGAALSVSPGLRQPSNG